MFDLLQAIAAQVWEMFGPAFDHGWPRLAVVELCFAPCAKFPTMFDPLCLACVGWLCQTRQTRQCIVHAPIFYVSARSSVLLFCCGLRLCAFQAAAASTL